jgi:DNA-binding NtrC family response regulator
LVRCAGTILVVDDESSIRKLLANLLTARQYQVLTAASTEEAVRLIAQTQVDLVLTDVRMPGSSGLDLVRHVADNLRHVPVILVTGYATIDGAIEALKTGATDYLVKPIDRNKLYSVVEASLREAELLRKFEPVIQAPPFDGILGASAPMRRVFREMARAADTDATVLIFGESGTGKELAARAIHYAGRRRSAPFVPVSCGAIPEGLLESELFGSMKGAFTGSTENRIGFFQAAEGGTLFLDEIGETSLSMQVRLLRVLQEKEIYMVGSQRPVKVDLRVLVATNRDLVKMVEKNLFRTDLFYRINVIPITLPPLRERGRDVGLLARHFIRKAAAELAMPEPSLTERASMILAEHDWPGNVRELENLMTRLVLMGEGDKIDVPDLPRLMRFSATQPKLHRSLAEVEIQHVRRVLESVDGNKTRAARILGIDRKTLRSKLKKQ